MALDKSKLDALKIDPEQRVRRGGGALYVAIAALVALLLAAGWYVLRPGAIPEVAVERAGSVSSSAASGAVLNASGYVVARRLATVSSRVTGRIEQVNIEEGMQVSAGDVLAVLDGATAEAQRALAESQLAAARTGFVEIEVRLEQAQLDLKRNLSLRERALISAALVDAARSDVRALEARLQNARSNVDVAQRQVELSEQALDDLVIRAPFSGVVIEKNAQPGEMISPISSGGFTRTGICTIVDMESLEIEVDVNESFINRVRSNQGVEAQLDAYPEWTIAAQVINIVPTADRQKATVKVRIGFGELDPRILPDMGVRVAFLPDAPPPGADSRPQPRATVGAGAVTRIGAATYVWVVGNGDVLERRAVRVGERQGAKYPVFAGLQPGEFVLSEPGEGLSEGEKVRVAE